MQRKLLVIIILILLQFTNEIAYGKENERSTVTPGQDKAVDYLLEHFGEEKFFPQNGFLLRQGQYLPKLVWARPNLVKQVVSKSEISYRWFNDKFEQVKIADKPGLYYVYGEAPAPKGPPLRQAMTCLCLKKGVDLTSLAENEHQISKNKSDKSKADALREILNTWNNTEEGALSLYEKLESNQPATPLNIDRWNMHNATLHVKLKRIVMGLDKTPPVLVRPRNITGNAATILHKPSAETAKKYAVIRKQLEEKFDEWFASCNLPMSIVVAKDGNIIFAKALGKLNGEPLTLNTPMRIDSAMKPIIGIQTAMYVDRGVFKLDEKIGNHLPDFNTPDDEKLTFRAGHTHCSGIAFPWPLAFANLFYFSTWQDSLIAHCKREWPAGAKHEYGVVGVILSVRALELYAGKNYWHAMESELFGPLDIKDARPGGKGFSVEDMARLGVLLANHGQYGQYEFFSEETYQAILPTPLSKYFPAVNKIWGIGLELGC
ncbi:MAG: serine hydrolase domain-containing protein [Victivallaceae bacterium]